MAEKKVEIFYYADGTKEAQELVFKGTISEFKTNLGSSTLLDLGDSFTYENDSGDETVRVYSITEKYENQDDEGTIIYHIGPITIHPTKFNI